MKIRTHCILIFLSVFLSVSPFIETLSAQTQQSKWYLDGKQIDFSTGSPIVSDMIVPFAGASFAANGVYNQGGDLLFYIRDQDLFGKDGSLIESLELNTEFEGESFIALRGEIAIVPHPTICSRLYLIYHMVGNALTDQNSFRLLYSEFDFSLNDGLGGILPDKKNITLKNSQTFLDNFSGLAVGGGNAASGTTFIYTTTHFEENDQFFGEINQFTIDESGIFFNEVIYIDIRPEPFRCLEADLSPNGSILAFGDGISSFTGNGLNLIFLDPVTGGLDASRGENGFLNILEAVDVVGVEFSPDNQRLFASSDLGIHNIEISTMNSEIIDNTIGFNTQIELASNQMMYVGRGGDGALSELNPVTGSFIVDKITGLGNAQISGFTLPDQIDGFDYDGLYADPPQECCALVSPYNAETYTVTTETTWAPGNNPFGGAATVSINKELIIKPGATLTIDGMEVEFGKKAQVSIEPDAKLVVNTSTLRPIDCGSTWGGINVWGTDQSQYVAANRGHLVLNDSRIEHARQAIYLFDPEQWPASSGGLVEATNTVFFNNHRSAAFIPFENTLNGNHRRNLSFFKNCTFTIDDEHRFTDAFASHISMWDVDGVRISGCTFESKQSLPPAKYSGRGSAILAIGSGFDIGYICNDQACSDPDGCTFTGFYKAIDVSGTDCGNLYQRYYMRYATFDQNYYGVYSTAMCNSYVLQSEFIIGNFEDMHQTFTHQIGVLINTGTNYKIEQNVFDGGGASSSSSWTTGVFIQDSGSDNNEVYNNEYFYLLFANVSYGQNRENPNTKDGFGGLRYFCNTNEDNNFDFRVTGVNSFVDGIATNQGVMPFDPTDNALRGAGNTFSHTGFTDFRNESTANPVVYWHHPTEDFPTVNLLNTTPNNQAKNPHVCEDNWIDGQLIESTAGESFVTAEPTYQLLQSELDNLSTQRVALMDGGDSPALIQEITTWNGSGIQLVEHLSGIHPYLSEDALQSTIDRTDILSDAQLYAILLENPDEVRKSSLINYLSENHPLSATQMEGLEASSKQSTSRTVLEGDIAALGAKITTLCKKVIYSIGNDEQAGTNYDQLRTWLDRKSSLESDFTLAETHLQEGNSTLALDFLNTLPSKWNLGGTDLEKFNHFVVLKNKEIDLQNTNRTWADLDETEISLLEDIAASNAGLAAGQAQGILHFFYDKNFTIEVTLPEAPIAPRRKVDAEPVRMLHAFPNPANDWMAFEYHGLEANTGSATIEVYSAHGKLLYSLLLDTKQHQLLWNTSELTNGIYFYTLSINNQVVETEQFSIMK